LHESETTENEREREKQNSVIQYHSLDMRMYTNEQRIHDLL